MLAEEHIGSFFDSFLEEQKILEEVTADAVKKMLSFKGKVLFVYPNKEGYGGIPNGLALLSACVKDYGFETKCFDTTFLNPLPETLLNREKHGGMIHVEYENYWGRKDNESNVDVCDFFLNTIKDFGPDLIAVTTTDVNYKFIVSLLNKVRDKINVPIIAGGITVTLNPEMVINEDCFDIICIGEGEDALVELCIAIISNRDYSNIQNLWVKKDGIIVKNQLRFFKSLNLLPYQDWSIFDKRHYFKPYCGKFYRTGFFELSRGCCYSCTFCCNSKLREVFKDCGKYIRTRSVERTVNEIKVLKYLYDLELVFFIDDNFLMMPSGRVENFCIQYRHEVGLPFYVQTRPETITDRNVKALKEGGVSTIAIGIENGNEEYRTKYLNRKMGNDVIKRAFEIIHGYDIRTTANIIFGMPFETEEMMQETIKLMQEIKPESYSINYYAPYRGTKMREVAIERRIIPEDHIVENSNVCLDIPGFSKDKITHYFENFFEYLKE